MELNTPPIRSISQLVDQLGQQVEAYRLSRDLKQADLAKRAGISRSTLIRLEAGKGGTVETLVRVLRALEIDDRLADLLPDAALSPLDPMSETGQRRQRVRDHKTDSAPWSWGDEPGQ
jgi:transcriptional regulator with XRE-family HTH domain